MQIEMNNLEKQNEILKEKHRKDWAQIDGYKYCGDKVIDAKPDKLARYTKELTEINGLIRYTENKLIEGKKDDDIWSKFF